MWRRAGRILRLLLSVALSYLVSAVVAALGVLIGIWLMSALESYFEHLSTTDQSLTNLFRRFPETAMSTAFFCAPFALPVIAVLEAVRARSLWIYGLCAVVVPFATLAAWIPRALFRISSSHIWTDLSQYAVFIIAGFFAGAAYRLARRLTFDIKPRQAAISVPPDVAA